MLKFKLLIAGLLFSLIACKRISDEDLAKAKKEKDPTLFLSYEEQLYTLQDKNDYFFKLASIQHQSGLAFGYYDPKDITKDSMFLIYKDNIHFVYQTYFNSRAFKTDNLILNSEKFQDWCVFHKRLNAQQKDSIHNIFDLNIPIDSLKEL